MTIYKHYTYLISNIKENKHYIGSRTCKKNSTPETDLGFKYFSSSTDEEFIQDQKVNPQDYTYQIINRFQLRKEAVWNEICLHKIFDVGVNPDFYNKVRQASNGFSADKGSKAQENRFKTMSEINEQGFTVFQTASIKRTKNMKIVLEGKTIYQKAGEKQSITKKLIEENGFSIAKNASIKCQKTMLIPDENGLTIKQKSAEKISKCRKESKIAVGKNNPSAKQIDIFNSNDEKIFECHGDFAKICKENNLPFVSLQKTYQQETKLYENISNYTLCRVKENIIFKGWYARIV